MSTGLNGSSSSRQTGLRKTTRVGKTARPLRRVVDTEGAVSSPQPQEATVVIEPGQATILDGVVTGLVDESLRARALEAGFVLTDETPDVAELEAASRAAYAAESAPEKQQPLAPVVAEVATSVSFDRHRPMTPALIAEIESNSQPIAPAREETAMQQRDRVAASMTQPIGQIGDNASYLMSAERAAELEAMAFNYVEIGTTRGIATIAELPSTLPDHYVPARQSVVMGHGAANFEASVARLLTFQFIRDAGVILATTAPVADRDVIVEQRTNVFGVTFVAPYRIIAVDREPHKVSFVMGTLTSHPEKGEERYSVYLNENDEIVFEIFSISATQSFVAKLGNRMARSVQSRMLTRFLDAAAAQQSA